MLTGATRGLGLAIAQRLKKEGYHVIATGRKLTPELDALVNESELQGKVSFYAFDLSATEEIHDFVQSIVKDHGPIFGLVNNAALGHDGVLATMHDSQISELVNVNVLSPILLTKYASRSMLMKRRGRIVNISSIIATTGFNGLSVYGSTKSAMTGFTKSLSRELGKRGITVNAVAPGYMATDMTQGLQGSKLESITRRSPFGKLATVEDVAGSISYLLSEDAKMITGTTITVDAGSTA